MKDFFLSILRALKRARKPILAVAIVYFASVVMGAVMAHTGNEFALSSRDRIVGEARSGPILNQRDPFSIALADFSANLRGASADALGGLGVVFPFPAVAYRGWVGGIVSVDGDYASRLLQPESAAYYVSVVIMQLTGYTLAAGAGINVGLALWRKRPEYDGGKWLGIPAEALRDFARIFILAIPILFFASIWEFLSPWN
ncbi:MAG: stage II sporulation protein M [Anaerolineales bacterium]